jgi:hypothetical protein
VPAKEQLVDTVSCACGFKQYVSHPAAVDTERWKLQHGAHGHVLVVIVPKQRSEPGMDNRAPR